MTTHSKNHRFKFIDRRTEIERLHDKLTGGCFNQKMVARYNELKAQTENEQTKA